MNSKQKHTTSLRLLHDGHIKIYIGEINQKCRYKFIYRNSVNGSISKSETDEFPLELIYSNCGYLFVNGKRNTISKYINKLPTVETLYDEDIRRTRYINLSKYFDEDSIVIVKCSGLKSTPVKMLKEIVLNITSDPITKIDNLYSHVIEEIEENFTTNNIKNIDDWIKYLELNCPINSINKLPFGYSSYISNNMFKTKKALTIDDIKESLELCYDIRLNKVKQTKHKDVNSLNEIDIIKAIEQYEDQDQYVIFYNNMNNRIKEVKKKLKEKGLEYEPVDIRKLLIGNPELRKKDSTDIAIKVKWSDLNKLGIQWTYSDFI